MTTLETLPEVESKALSDTQVQRTETVSFLELVSSVYPSEKAELIFGELNTDDLKVINNTPGMGPYDYYAVARANQILAEAPELVADFDRLKPRDFSQYMRLQASWLMNDIYLLGIRLRRKPEQKEISEDLEGRK